MRCGFNFGHSFEVKIKDFQIIDVGDCVVSSPVVADAVLALDNLVVAPEFNFAETVIRCLGFVSNRNVNQKGSR